MNNEYDVVCIVAKVIKKTQEVNYKWWSEQGNDYRNYRNNDWILEIVVMNRKVVRTEVEPPNTWMGKF